MEAGSGPQRTGATPVVAPRDDDEVPAFWRSLGLPGLVDIHTHFMPEPVLRKVWAYFDAAAVPGGGGWPVRYRLPEDERLRILRAMGVRTFTAMVYPHKPGMAAWLNAWARDFAGRTPDCAMTATFYPEPGVQDYVAEALASGVRVFKLHVGVGAYDPRDPLLDPVWGMVAEAGVPVVVHAGKGPEPGPFTGIGPFAQVMAAHPRLVAVIAHMGGPEYREFIDLALRYERVHLDTTMVFTGFMARLGGAFPADLVPVLAAHPEKVVLGTDFPNIPYAYAHQLSCLVELGVDAAWLRAVCHDNGARLLGVSPTRGPGSV